VTDFEDPTSLARCIKSDCQAYRAGGTPFCAEHLREQEKASAGISEPEVEELARAAGDAVMAETYFGADPDTVPPSQEERLRALPDPAELEPHWDAGQQQWILRPKPADPLRGYPQKIARVESLVRELMFELGIPEGDGR
jgi:hypothetical protein